MQLEKGYYEWKDFRFKWPSIYKLIKYTRRFSWGVMGGSLQGFSRKIYWEQNFIQFVKYFKGPF